MKNNNLSNRGAPCILIKVEDFLVEYKNKNAWDKVANLLVGKENRATLNEDVVSAMFFIFRKTDMTVDLTCDEGSSLILKSLLEDLPFGRLLEIKKPVQIAVKLNKGEYLYYVDCDQERMSVISHRRCITLTELMNELRGGYTFV